MSRNLGMDHETRANRFLDAMSVVRDLLTSTPLGTEVPAANLGQLLDLLNDEARLVIVPFRMGANDDDGDPPE